MPSTIKRHRRRGAVRLVPPKGKKASSTGNARTHARLRRPSASRRCRVLQVLAAAAFSRHLSNLEVSECYSAIVHHTYRTVHEPKSPSRSETLHLLSVWGAAKR